MKYSGLTIMAAIVLLSSCSPKMGESVTSSTTNTGSTEATSSMPIQANSAQAARKEATATTDKKNAGTGATEITIPSGK